MTAGDDIGLERLLDYDRRRYWLVNDWSVRLRVHRVRAHPGRPAGIKYSFTLHDDGGRRLLGFDNAAVERACSVEGVPFQFDAEDVLDDPPMEDDDDA